LLLLLLAHAKIEWITLLLLLHWLSGVESTAAKSATHTSWSLHLGIELLLLWEAAAHAHAHTHITASIVHL
jgi:hypothetical protein